MGNQSVLHARESRSQTVHTIKFQSWIHGTLPSELKIEETDVTGFTRVESWEHHFYGIFNHGDYNATSWQNAQYMANYWRQFFNVETEGDSFPSYPDQSTGWASAWGNVELRDDAPDDVDPPTHHAPAEGLPIPQNLMQLALVLDSIMAQSPPGDHMVQGSL